MTKQTQFSPEERERVVWPMQEGRSEYGTQWRDLDCQQDRSLGGDPA